VIEYDRPSRSQVKQQPNPTPKGDSKTIHIPPQNCILSYIFINIYIPLRQASLATLRAIAFYLLVVNNADDKS
jgi:hypothetical protein